MAPGGASSIRTSRKKQSDNGSGRGFSEHPRSRPPHEDAGWIVELRYDRPHDLDIELRLPWPDTGPPHSLVLARPTTSRVDADNQTLLLVVVEYFLPDRHLFRALRHHAQAGLIEGVAR